MLNNKTILITGGTGSFGGVHIKSSKILPKVKEIRIFSRDEKKQHDMRKDYSHNKIKFLLVMLEMYRVWNLHL